MNIQFSKSAIKFMDKLTDEMKMRMIQAIQKIPYGDIKPLKGKQQDFLRLRVGKVRIIFTIQSEEIMIIKIDNRGDIYK